jgi:hypothetical protein
MITPHYNISQINASPDIAIKRDSKNISISHSKSDSRLQRSGLQQAIDRNPINSQYKIIIEKSRQN